MKHTGPRDTLLILGSARSGTTWLAEIVNRTRRYKYLFEPFHAEKASSWKGLGWYQVLDAKSATQQTAQIIALRKILNGEIDEHDKWVFGRGIQYESADRIMIKDVRIQFMLPAMYAVKPTLQTILLLRDPVNVIKSRIKGGFPSSDTILADREKLALIDKKLVDDYIASCGDSSLALMVFKWALENRVALDFLKKQSSSLVLRYEDIKSNPLEAMQAIIGFLDVDEDPAALAEQVTTPSSTSRLAKNLEVSAHDVAELRRCADAARHIFKL